MASTFGANFNFTNFTMPDCSQCIDSSGECGECIRRCGQCIGNEDPAAMNADHEPCSTCEVCNEWIPCAVVMHNPHWNDSHPLAPCAQHGLSDEYSHSKPDGSPCGEGCECCRSDGSCGECRGDYICETVNGTSGAFGTCISCEAKFAGDQATIDRCKAEAGVSFEHHGVHYDNTCLMHYPNPNSTHDSGQPHLDMGGPCGTVCNETVKAGCVECLTRTYPFIDKDEDQVNGLEHKKT